MCFAGDDGACAHECEGGEYPLRKQSKIDAFTWVLMCKFRAAHGL